MPFDTACFSKDRNSGEGPEWWVVRVRACPTLKAATFPVNQLELVNDELMHRDVAGAHCSSD
eukprot:356453-Chlamydomonas_euryale.AAC.5